jgi:hypothetical protein
MQGQRKHTLSYSSGSAARRDDDRDASSGGRREIDVVHTDPGAGDDTQPRGAREKRGINDGVGPNDRADGVGDVLFAWICDKGNFLAEDPIDQRRIYGAKCHDHRTVDSHDLTRSQ